MSKPRIAVYPGSFDPVTNGHTDIIRRASRLFDKVIVLVSVNAVKSPSFSSVDRVKLITKVVDGLDLENVVVDIWDGLLVDYIKLTNNPPFDVQMYEFSKYMSLSPQQPKNNYDFDLQYFSRGMGALGLPGDLSSPSRFAKVAFTKLNSKSADDEKSSVGQFFHILGSVDQQRGCCEVADGKYEITIYTSCCNADKGIYYYTTYNCRKINAVDMHRVDLDSDKLFAYNLIDEEDFFFQN